jgi:hypothetical protein
MTKAAAARGFHALQLHSARQRIVVHAARNERAREGRSSPAVLPSSLTLLPAGAVSSGVDLECGAGGPGAHRPHSSLGCVRGFFGRARNFAGMCEQIHLVEPGQ